MSARLQSAGSIEAKVVSQYVWGARPGHRDELDLRDSTSVESSSGSDSSSPPLDERLWCLMDYYDPTSTVDNSGAVVERYSFSAFGLRSIMAPDFSPREVSDYAWDFGFKGQFLDLDTCYYNYGYRYYSPELGRWLSRDPIGEKGGNNLYVIANNNLVVQLDPFGLFVTNVDTEVVLHSVEYGIIYTGIAFWARNFFPDAPALTVNSTDIHDQNGQSPLSGSTPEIHNTLFNEAKQLCAKSSIEITNRTVSIQTGDIWSLGQMNLLLSGTLKCVSRNAQRITWSFEGSVDPQPDRFDFTPLLNNRGVYGEIVNFGGAAASYLGTLTNFDINFTGPINIDDSGVMVC